METSERSLAEFYLSNILYQELENTYKPFLYRIYYIQNNGSDKTRDITIDFGVSKGCIFSLTEKHINLHHYTNLGNIAKNLKIDIVLVDDSTRFLNSVREDLKSLHSMYTGETSRYQKGCTLGFYGSSEYESLSFGYLLNIYVNHNASPDALVSILKLVSSSFTNKPFKSNLDTVRAFIEYYKSWTTSNPSNKEFWRYPPGTKISEFRSILQTPIIKDISLNLIFYVYRHYYFDKQTSSDITFYVGKGSGDRAFDRNLTSRNELWKNTVMKLEMNYKIDIICKFETESKAYKVESLIITYFKEVKNQCTCNKST